MIEPHESQLACKRYRLIGNRGPHRARAHVRCRLIGKLKYPKPWSFTLALQMCRDKMKQTFGPIESSMPPRSVNPRTLDTKTIFALIEVLC